jgi:FtsP/CotA-like multicopper oxidase with cupredoxin domain
LGVDRKRTWFALGLTIFLVALFIAGVVATQMQSSSQSSGLATNIPAYNYKPQVRNFTLYVRDNVIKMPDGKQIYVFGYTDDPHGHAKVPAPPIVVNENDTVNITLINDKDPTKSKYSAGDGHTIHLHGLDLSSTYDGDPMTVPPHTVNGEIITTPIPEDSGTQPIEGPVMEGQRFTYHFIANHVGTYWYHCHVDVQEHVQMGMYGAIVVQPVGSSNQAYLDTPTFNKQYTFVLSEMDSTGHQIDYNNIYNNGPVMNWTHYQPDYFLINGKAYPATLTDPNTSITCKPGQTILLRFVDAGSEVRTISFPGLHPQIIATDGRKLDNPYTEDTLRIGPAERYDLILHLDHTGQFMIHDHIENNATRTFSDKLLTAINVTA